MFETQYKYQVILERSHSEVRITSPDFLLGRFFLRRTGATYEIMAQVTGRLYERNSLTFLKQDREKIANQLFEEFKRKMTTYWRVDVSMLQLPRLLHTV